MTTKYTWHFSNFDKSPSYLGLPDVVRAIHWRLVGERNGVRAGISGVAILRDPDPSRFVSYEDISKGWAIETTSSLIDLDATKVILEGIINKKSDPAIAASDPPF